MKTLIIDADHTLINYTLDERSAFARLFARFSLFPTEDELAVFNKLSEESWTEAGLYKVGEKDIQARFHELYRYHVFHIFEKIYRDFPKYTALAPKEMSTLFLAELENEDSHEMPNALGICKYLHEKGYKIYVATNGLIGMQRGRLKKFMPYITGLFVSEELNAIKPTEEFFRKMLEKIGDSPENCLMIGDSYNSDVVGSRNVGIDSILYNSRKETNFPIPPNKIISSLTELKEIL